jgi:hypothetical protein
MFRGAMVRKGHPTPGNQSIPDNVATMVVFHHVDYDTDSFYSSLTPTRLTVPAGVSKVRLVGQAIFQRGNGTGFRQIVIKKNGQFFPGDPCVNVNANNVTTSDLVAISPVLPVAEGDYFELEVFHSDGAALPLLASTGTFFAIEAVE